MKTHTHPLRAVARAISLLLLAGTAHSQVQQTLKPVTVTGQAFPPAADVTGFGDVPLKDVPVSASVIDSRMIEQTGARRLADLTRYDPSVADAYNAPGYWDFLSVRGYVLDNRYNYRREGLPASAETTIPLDNKERIEILRGTSGMQAGTSAPGGLVNYVVKRPTDSDLRAVRVEFTQRASLLAAADLGGRFGNGGAFGYRLNVAQEQLRPLVRGLDGRRSLVSFAGDWRLANEALLEGEVEWSRKVQASQAGFSLLGGVLTSVPDPRLNLNNQPWLQPSRFDALTGTLRYSQPVARDWRVSLQAGTQRLKSDDYTAFPFGCSSENNYTRFCSDGTFDYYDYRSIGEKRRHDSLALDLKGKAEIAGTRHDVSFGVLRDEARDRLPDYAYNWVGFGNVDGTAIVGEDARPLYPGTRRDERSLEFSARDAIHWNDRATTWLGVRHTRLDRSNVPSDGVGATGYSQSLTTPWAAASYKLGGGSLAYASWGQGVESRVVPNMAGVYTNAGAVLPALKSRQWELGFKGTYEAWTWQASAFDIRRPVTNVDTCAAPCTARTDGVAHHRGLEAALHWASGAWRAGATAMALKATREGSTEDPAANGLRPVNVPQFVARAYGAWRLPGVDGLELQASLSHEGSRPVLANESVMLPAWTRVDAALRYQAQLGATATTWLLGVDNVTNRRYWRESPFQFGHVYLYPGAQRTLRLSVTVSL
ncbi:TonB-dependent siderophore receptor [Ramlibacter sp. PS4R-6]|uniref:TonB-dependent siderophore receptor n=1 Tax=Ramlibacter sp. PS4R-6 TaxID=3133438 RepID=UPI00309FDEA9